MNLKAKILEIFETTQVTDTFKKREFVVEYAENPQYPEFIKFELTQDRCDLISQYKLGDEVDVWFNLRGRKWTDPQGQVKYFNSLQAWKIDSVHPENTQPTEGGLESQKEPEWLSNNDDDDLPF